MCWINSRLENNNSVPGNDIVDDCLAIDHGGKMVKRICTIQIFSLITLLLVSCASTTTISPVIENTPTTTVPESTAISPTLITVPTGLPFQLYDDVRDDVLTSIDADLGKPLIQTLWFNENTQWSEQNLESARDILQKGMNPGLGVRSLHAQGITGEGISVAIIDQNLQLDHPEFEGKIIKYFDVGTNRPPEEGSMHGPAVTSLLVGDNIGTAPGATVYYVAAPSWIADAQYYADALDWIIDENETLPDDSKIRVVSVSAAPSGEGSPFATDRHLFLLVQPSS